MTLPLLACNALKKSEAAGDAGVALASATTAPKPDPDSCKQARALRASGNPAWQKLAPQCTAQGGKI